MTLCGVRAATGGRPYIATRYTLRGEGGDKPRPYGNTEPPYGTAPGGVTP